MAFKHYLANLILFLSIIFLIPACSSNDVDYTPPPGSTETAITHYAFGKMIIDGKTYGSDLAIQPGGKVSRWSFEASTHEITSENLNQYISDQVKTIIIGKGYASNAYLSSSAKALIEKLKAKGTMVHVLPSSKAVMLYNSSSKEGLLAFFHLNC
jgi:hypothetical protein